jgi:hypothetical protein
MKVRLRRRSWILDGYPVPLKAAILVHAGGKKVEQKLFPLLEEEERNLLQELLSQMEEVSPDLLENVAKEFVQLCEGGVTFLCRSRTGTWMRIRTSSSAKKETPPP